MPRFMRTMANVIRVTLTPTVAELLGPSTRRVAIIFGGQLGAAYYASLKPSAAPGGSLFVSTSQNNGQPCIVTIDQIGTAINLPWYFYLQGGTSSQIEITEILLAPEEGVSDGTDY